MAWQLNFNPGGGKTRLAMLSTIKNFDDMILALALFGDDSSTLQSSLLSQSANSKLVDLCNDHVVIDSDGDLKLVKTHTELINLLTEKYHMINYDVYEDLVYSNLYFNKNSASLSSMILSHTTKMTRLDDSEIYSYFKIDTQFTNLLLSLRKISDSRVEIVDVGVAYQNLIDGSLKFTYPTYVQTEGKSQCPLYFNNLVEIHTQAFDIEAHWDKYLKDISSDNEPGVLDSLTEDYPMTLEAIADECAVNMINLDMFIKDVLSRFDDIAKASNWPKVKNLEKVLRIAYKIRRLKFQRFIRTLNVSSFKQSKNVITGCGADGTQISKELSPMSIHFNIRGIYYLDSILTYVFAPSSSYLPKGISSELVNAFALSTFSSLVALYAPLGDAFKDPMLYYSVEGINSGDIFTNQTDIFGSKKIELPVYVTHRATNRSRKHCLVKVVDPMDTKYVDILSDDETTHSKILIIPVWTEDYLTCKSLLVKLVDPESNVTLKVRLVNLDETLYQTIKNDIVKEVGNEYHY